MYLEVLISMLEMMDFTLLRAGFRCDLLKSVRFWQAYRYFWISMILLRLTFKFCYSKSSATFSMGSI